jgi:hypothetical protein
VICLTEKQDAICRLSHFVDSQVSDSDDNLSDPAGKERQSRSRDEPRKIAFGLNRLRAFKHFAIFHAIPIAVSLYLIYINIRGRLWRHTA